MEKNQFENLIVWKKAHSFVLAVYKVSAIFPKEEMYGLTNQLRRSVASIPTNIVEGKGRNSIKEYIQFLYISRGSLEETKYHILLSKDQGYISEESYEVLMNKANEVGKLLHSLINSLKEKN